MIHLTPLLVNLLKRKKIRSLSKPKDLYRERMLIQSELRRYTETQTVTVEALLALMMTMMIMKMD